MSDQKRTSAVNEAREIIKRWNTGPEYASASDDLKLVLGFIGVPLLFLGALAWLAYELVGLLS
jgi:hypothetical protein